MRHLWICLFCWLLLPSAAAQLTPIAFGVPVLSQDHSLTLAEYHQAGVPPLDRPWGLPDYQQAAQAFTAIAQQNPSHLPRHNSPRSGQLFAYLFNIENLPNTKDAATLEQTQARLQELQQLTSGPLLEITNAYLMSLDLGFSQPLETCTAIGFITQALPRAHDLAEQATAQGRPVDPARTTALEKSTINAFVSAIQLLRHTGQQSVDAKQAMLDRVVPAYLKIRPRLSPAANAQIQLAVDRALAQEASEDIQTQLRLIQNN